MSDYYGAVRVAEYNLGTHFNQAVNEEEPALEHFLVNQYAASALGGHDQKHAQEVRGQAGPRGVRYCHNRPVHERIYNVAFLLRDEDIVTALLQVHSYSPETLRDDAEILVGDVLYGDAAAVHCGHSDETSHFQHIRKNLVFGSFQ